MGRARPERASTPNSLAKAVAHEYAVRLALIAVTTVTVQALIEGAAFEPAVSYALLTGAACYALGWLCGELARRIVEETWNPQRRAASRGSRSPDPSR
jgi:hypothetical protein